MADLNPSFIVKLGAIPQPILATLALIAEAKQADPKEVEPGVDRVDIENLVRETTRPTQRPNNPGN